MVMYKIDKRGGGRVVQKSVSRTDPDGPPTRHLGMIVHLLINQPRWSINLSFSQDGPPSHH